VADALSLPFGAGEFDVVASALVLHFLPDRRKAFGEMHRVVKPGGIVAGYTWNRTSTETFAPYAPMARAFKSIGIEPTLSPLVPEASPDGLKATLDATGLRNADITFVEVTRSFASFEEFWQIQTMTFHPIGKSFAKCSDGAQTVERRLAASAAASRRRLGQLSGARDRVQGNSGLKPAHIGPRSNKIPGALFLTCRAASASGALAGECDENIFAVCRVGVDMRRGHCPRAKPFSRRARPPHRRTARGR